MKSVKREVCLDADVLRERLDYNPETGEFTWRRLQDCRGTSGSWNTRLAGKLAGAFSAGIGYWVIRVKGKLYLAHRLAWLYVYGEWPRDEIDHINHNRLDNRISNLREASSRDNSRNSSMLRNNTSGVKGVSWSRGKWYAYIKVKGRKIHIGCFEDLGEAAEARKSAERKYGFHKNHGVGAEDLIEKPNL